MTTEVREIDDSPQWTAEELARFEANRLNEHERNVVTTVTNERIVKEMFDKAREAVRPRERYYRDVPRLLRWLGCWGIQRDLNRPNYRFSWGEVSVRFGLGLAYSVYHEEAHLRIQLLWPSMHIKVPMIINQRPGTEDWLACYGFSWFERTIHLNWRDKTKILHMPWDWEHVRHEVYDKDQKLRPWKAPWRSPEDGGGVDDRHTESHPFVYVLKSGEIQRRTATIYGEEREWRWRWFTWLPRPRRINRSIDVTFNDEVGERTGSWKGGCTGCGADWRKGETMLDALRRMELERTF